MSIHTDFSDAIETGDVVAVESLMQHYPDLVALLQQLGVEWHRCTCHGTPAITGGGLRVCVAIGMTICDGVVRWLTPLGIFLPDWWQRMRPATTNSHGGSLMSITFNLDDDQSARLEARARELGVNVHALAKAAVNDLLCRQSDDFERAAQAVLQKNRELYHRLS